MKRPTSCPPERAKANGRRRARAVGWVSLLASFACSTAQSTLNGDPSKEFAPRSSRPHVPAGTTIRTSLNEGFDLETSEPNQRFTAMVTEPVRSEAGIAIPRGGLLRGRLVGVSGGEQPEIRLIFESIDTVTGPTPIHVCIGTVRRYGYDEWLERAIPSYRSFVVHDFEPPIPSGASAGRSRATGIMVRVPRGSSMDVVLTQPIQSFSQGPNPTERPPSPSQPTSQTIRLLARNPGNCIPER